MLALKSEIQSDSDISYSRIGVYQFENINRRFLSNNFVMLPCISPRPNCESNSSTLAPILSAIIRNQEY